MPPTHLTTRLLFEYLQMRQSATVPEIAARLRMPAPTVTGILSRMVRKRLVARTEPQSGRRGRPCVKYRLRLPHPVVAFNWEGTEVAGAVLDSELNVKSLEIIDLKPCNTLSDALLKVDELLESLLAGNNMTRSQLPGVAMRFNAVSIAGQPPISSVVPWANESMAQTVADALGVPLRITLKAAMTSDYRRLPDPPPRSMCSFRAGDGVSAHAIEAGQPVLGRNSLAGELGHIRIEENGRLCGCGRRGCLETRCSGPAIQRRAIEDLRHGVSSELSLAQIEALPPHAAVERIWKAWRSGDSFAHALMDPVLDSLAWAFGVVVNLQDPDTIVAGGYVLKNHPDWIAEIERRAQRWILHAAKRQTQFVASQASIEDELCVIAAQFHPHAVPDELVSPQNSTEFVQGKLSARKERKGMFFENQSHQTS